ncbi:unnamed protein product [Polarella glacialis]|uniref:EamA domain-containing protein n=1 Tax=Polarella glacialis TaxID=89957 RepID=A0A813EYT8_POLGL|nr:unnamed protein product [Polarella glacialis]|mmetsp:Transcript_77026/g.124662  ORF Transcript_77026/g.124662 Transcript_77026/m.124662 type:complete len:356 (-) Transcript_77026:113-1180(-)
MKESSLSTEVEGTCLVVGAAMVFALVALVVKRDPLPLVPATECRFSVSWVIAAGFMSYFKESRGLAWFGPPELRKWLVLKCALSFAFITIWWAAIRMAPVGDCIAIIYCAPILTSFMSSSLLGEKLPRFFGFQIVLVLAGTCLVVNPPFLRHWLAPQADSAVPTESAERPDYRLALFALIFGAFVPLATKKCRSCSWIEVEHVNASLASAVLNPSVAVGNYAWYGALPELPAAAPAGIALIMLAAIGSFIGIAMETKGYQLAEIGRASMFRYVEVPFAYVLQQFGTSEPVQPQAIFGACLILSSCVLGVVEKMLQAPKDEQSKQAVEPLISGPGHHDDAEEALANSINNNSKSGS